MTMSSLERRSGAPNMLMAHSSDNGEFMRAVTIAPDIYSTRICQPNLKSDCREEIVLRLSAEVKVSLHGMTVSWRHDCFIGFASGF